jgi:hypothetical protein
MKSDLEHVCRHHSDRYDCPDGFVAPVRGGYGLMIHDGGESVIEIGFCPWCGTALPPIQPLDPSEWSD